MTELDYLHLYLFDIFNKNKETKDLIDLLNRRYGQSREEPGTITIVGSGKNVKETKYRWQISDTKKILEEIEKTCNEKMPSDMTLAKSAISEINFVGLQNDELPYFVLVMSVSIEKNRLEFDQLFNNIGVLLRPLRIFFEEFNGITRQQLQSKPICPYFADIGIIKSDDEIKQILGVSTEMLEAEGIYHESSKRDYLIARSEIIRKIPPLNGIRYGFNLLSMPRMFSNTLSFTGHLEQPAFNGFMTAFFMAFTSQKRWPEGFNPNTFLTIRASGYNGLSTPVGNAGTMIYLLTMNSWLSHMERSAIALGSELNGLREKARELIESNKIDLEKDLTELDKKGSVLASFISEIGQLIRNNESAIKEFKKGRTSTAVEIPVLPVKNDYWIWSTITESTGSGAYLQSIALMIEDSLHKIKNILDQYSYENDKLHSHMISLVNIRTQKTMKRHSEISLFSTGVILILTGVLAFFAFVQYNNENFPPELHAVGGDIIMENNLLGNSDYSKGITVSASGNHHDLKFTVSHLKTYISGLGKCYFQSGPNIELVQPESSTLDAGKESVVVIPELDIRYIPNAKYVLLNNSTAHQIGYVLGVVGYDLDVIDIQNGNKYHTTAGSDILLNLPPGDIDQFRC